MTISKSNYVAGVQCLKRLYWQVHKPELGAQAEQQQWYADKTDYDNEGLALASDTEAYGGHLGKARELTKRAVDSAIRADNKEGGAIWQANAALEQAAFGNPLSPTGGGRGSEACSHESGGRS